MTDPADLIGSIVDRVASTAGSVGPLGRLMEEIDANVDRIPTELNEYG